MKRQVLTSLRDTFAKFYEAVLSRHGFRLVEDSHMTASLGQREDFENNFAVLRLGIDRSDAIITIRYKSSANWLLLERLLCYLEGSLREPMEPAEIARQFDQNYDLIESFFDNPGFEDREKDFRRYAIEHVANRNPHWKLENTDTWNELHKA